MATFLSTLIFSSYDIEARIERAHRLAKEFLEPLSPGVAVRNSVDDHVQWLKTTPRLQIGDGSGV